MKAGKNGMNNLGLIIVLLIVGLIAVGAINLSTTGGVAIGESTVTGVCPDSGTVDIRVAAFNDLAANKDQVASKVSVFLPGSATPTETITTSATALASSTTDLDCNTDYTLVFGHTDESNYYTTWVEGLNTGASATNTHRYALEKVGSVALSASNTTSQGIGSGIFLTLGASEDNSDLVLRLKENTADAYFGQGESLICFDYETSDYVSMEIVEGTSQAVPTIASGYEKCWKVATPELKDYGSQDFRIFVDTQAGVNPNATSGNFTVKVFDYQDFEFLGEKYWTVEDPADNTAIGATDATYAVKVL